MVKLIENIDLINDIDKYDMVLVGTNTYHTMGNGFQHKIRVNYPDVYKTNILTKYGDINKLGTYKLIKLNNQKKTTIVLCFISKGFNFRPDLKSEYLDYNAIIKVLEQIDLEYKNKNIATTILGHSKYEGNGDKDKLLNILTNKIKKNNLFIYDYEQLDYNKERVRLFYKLKSEHEETGKDTSTDIENIKLSTNNKNIGTNPNIRLKKIKNDILKIIKDNAK